MVSVANERNRAKVDRCGFDAGEWRASESESNTVNRTSGLHYPTVRHLAISGWRILLPPTLLDLRAKCSRYR
jgi:hypothetical protein